MQANSNCLNGEHELFITKYVKNEKFDEMKWSNIQISFKVRMLTFTTMTICPQEKRSLHKRN